MENYRRLQQTESSHQNEEARTSKITTGRVYKKIWDISYSDTFKFVSKTA